MYTTAAALAGYLAASERQPGPIDTIARALLRLKGIISANKQQIGSGEAGEKDI